MAPREQILRGETVSETGKTVVLHTKDGAPYVICQSSEAFVNPTTPPGTKPEDVMKELNLDLGQTIVTRNNKPLLWVIKFLDGLCFEWWETVVFNLWRKVPLWFRRAVTFGGWNIYFPLHKFLLGRRTGMHPSQSEEYHALTTLMWWARFFVITPRRMRFSLSQLYACTPNTVQSRVENVEDQIMIDPTPEKQKDNCTVRGMYLHQAETRTEKTIFWAVGGAYLGGDPLGNSSAADWVGNKCKMDVFVPDFRLAPEADLDDVMWDVCLAYKWLTQRVEPSNIVLLGISSGGAVCVRLMQMIAELHRGEELVPSYIAPLLRDSKMPKGAVLFGPYIDYTEPKQGSFLHYPRLDLVVTESVQDYGLPYLDDFIPSGRRREYSPVYRSMQGLPPMCVIVSEHEAVYDMAIQLVDRARSQGVPVTLGVWKYMCHVFSLLWGFVPEGQISMDFACEWIQQQVQDDR